MAIVEGMRKSGGRRPWEGSRRGGGIPAKMFHVEHFCSDRDPAPYKMVRRSGEVFLAGAPSLRYPGGLSCPAVARKCSTWHIFQARRGPQQYSVTLLRSQAAVAASSALASRPWRSIAKNVRRGTILRPEVEGVKAALEETPQSPFTSPDVTVTTWLHRPRKNAAAERPRDTSSKRECQALSRCRRSRFHGKCSTWNIFAIRSDSTKYQVGPQDDAMRSL